MGCPGLKHSYQGKDLFKSSKNSNFILALKPHHAKTSQKFCIKFLWVSENQSTHGRQTFFKKV